MGVYLDHTIQLASRKVEGTRQMWIGRGMKDKMWREVRIPMSKLPWKPLPLWLQGAETNQGQAELIEKIRCSGPFDHMYV